MIGESLGPYKILEPLGAGGMGEVYLGEDTRLNRKVAIKVLPAEFASDPERLARFEQESRAAAALNHPHIAAVFDVGFEDQEDSGAVHFMVQEYLEGQTLGDVLRKGALPLGRALSLGIEMAEALSAAHGGGIVHRDLKPANVFISKEGHAKVLDFGLAKLLEVPMTASPGVSKSPTLLGTVAGQVMGTAGYMAPEQVEGSAEVDYRADIFAFGCVLYEMTSGRQAFSGKSTLDTLHRIAHGEPESLANAPGNMPAELDRILKKCLAKEPERRYQTAGDLVVDLRTLASEVEAGTAAPLSPKASVESHTGAQRDVPDAVAGPASSHGWLPWAAAVLLGVGGVIAGSQLRSAPEPPPLVKFSVEVTGTFDQIAALSPNGRMVAYHVDDTIWVRDLARLESRRMAGTEKAQRVFWSPDSTEIGYFREGSIWRAPVSGGESQRVCEFTGPFSGGMSATWSQDDRIYFTQDIGPIMEVAARGGDPQPVVDYDEDVEFDFHDPIVLPDSSLVYTVHRIVGDGEATDTLEIFDGVERRVLLTVPGQRLANVLYSPTGHILYVREGTNSGIWAVEFELKSHEIRGEPFLVVASGVTASVSDNGMLSYLSATSDRLHTVRALTRDGNTGAAGADPGGNWVQLSMQDPAVSPDGTQVAVSAVVDGNRDIWIHDLARTTSRRLTSAPEDDAMPAWSRDGDRIAFVRGTATRTGLSLFIADLSSGAEQMVVGDLVWEPEFDPDGEHLLYTRIIGGDPHGFERLPLSDLDAVPEIVYDAGAGFAQAPAISPDGRYIAYSGGDDDQRQIYLQEYPTGGAIRQASVNGGYWPRWSPEGSELFFLSEDGQLMSVTVETNPELRLDSPRVLFEMPADLVPEVDAFPTGRSGFDVSPDGGFVFLRLDAATGASTASENRIFIVQNWLAEFDDGSR